MYYIIAYIIYTQPEPDGVLLVYGALGYVNCVKEIVNKYSNFIPGMTVTVCTQELSIVTSMYCMCSPAHLKFLTLTHAHNNNQL